MHEFSLMQNILQVALDKAKQAGSKRIKRIHATVIESGHPMESEPLQDLLQTLAKDTIAEEAEMRIDVIPPTLRCKECNFTFPAQGNTLICPKCRSGKLEETDAEAASIKDILME